MTRFKSGRPDEAADRAPARPAPTVREPRGSDEVANGERTVHGREPDGKLTFSARPEVWRALTDAWYGETNRTSAADHRDAEGLIGDIDEAATKAIANA